MSPAATAPAPVGQPVTSASVPSPSVMLMSDGRILRGEVSEDGRDYVVRQNGGEIRVRKSDVEKLFESIEADQIRRGVLAAPS